MANNNSTACVCYMPVAVIGFVLFLSLAFQMVQIERDRDSMHAFIAQQDKPLEEAKKVQTQLSALALGTKKLADNGNRNAAAIIGRLKDAGITVEPPVPGAAAAGAPAVAPTPAPVQ